MGRDNRRSRAPLLQALLLCLPSAAWGLSTDRDQPIHIESDSATLKQKEGISTYTGNVHLRQGTLNMHGNEMNVLLNDNRIVKIILTGDPATYVQRPDGKDTDRHAEAKRIEYYTENERLILIDAAHIWQPGSEDFRSDRIVINLEKDTVDAGGGAQDRVRITLQPKSSRKNGNQENGGQADGNQKDGGQADGNQKDGGQADGDQEDGGQADGDQQDSNQENGEEPAQ